MIIINNKKNCCGCTACYSICPKNAIIMKQDNEGFKYPQVNNDLCNNCGLCNKVCPIQICKKEEKKKQTGFLFQNANTLIRRESTSGGAFSAIGEYIIKQGGVVVGASYDDNFRVVHTIVDNIDALRKFRNSKYVQSDLNDIFKQVKKFLVSSTLVCFSGTPCQVEGLLSFLGKKYDNLLCVDIVCHAVPSPKLWDKYLQLQNSKMKKATNILFRDKYPNGYKYSSMSIYYGDNVMYSQGVESDKMLRAFFSEISNRPSCYDCKFKKRYRESDITIWDCFDVYRFSTDLDDDKGTTKVLIHSDNGRKIMNEVVKNNVSLEVNPNDLCCGVKEMVNSVEINPKRGEFFCDIDEMAPKDLFNKYFPNSFEMYLMRYIRKFLIITGLYTFAKRCKHKIMFKG